jgi:hypothetical protein
MSRATKRNSALFAGSTFSIEQPEQARTDRKKRTRIEVVVSDVPNVCNVVVYGQSAFDQDIRLGDITSPLLQKGMGIGSFFLPLCIRANQMQYCSVS